MGQKPCSQNPNDAANEVRAEKTTETRKRTQEKGKSSQRTTSNLNLAPTAQDNRDNASPRRLNSNRKQPRSKN